jgi:hypothetical protein
MTMVMVGVLLSVSRDCIPALEDDDADTDLPLEPARF